MSSGLSVEVAVPGAEGVRIEWDERALRAIKETGAEGRPWSLAGEPDWERVEALRVISAAFEDGRVLALAALRPAGAEGHDAEVVAGLMGGPESEVDPLAEVLISTEYGPDDAPRRLGLELHRELDGTPLRVAGALDADDERIVLRLDGTTGYGLLDVLRRG